MPASDRRSCSAILSVRLRSWKSSSATAQATRSGDPVLWCIREDTAKHRGVEVKLTGDGCWCCFPPALGRDWLPVIAMQRGIARLDLENPLLGLGLRSASLLARPPVRKGDWYGTPVVEAKASLCGGEEWTDPRGRTRPPARGHPRRISVHVARRDGAEGPRTGLGVGGGLGAQTGSVGGPSSSAARISACADLRWSSEGAPPWMPRGGEWKRQARSYRRDGRAGDRQDPSRRRQPAPSTPGGTTVLYGAAVRRQSRAVRALRNSLAWYVATAPAGDLRTQLGSLGGELVRIVRRSCTVRRFASPRRCFCRKRRPCSTP